MFTHRFVRLCLHYSSENKELSNGTAVDLAVVDSGWRVACTTVEEWNEVIESLKGSKHAETRRLLRALQGTFLYLWHKRPLIYSADQSDSVFCNC